MKKTLTITLHDIVFHIEEDAYDALSTYLSKINEIYSTKENGRAIITDIESRITELFRQRLTREFWVITLPLVNEIIGIMGMPEDFTTTSAGENTADQNRPSKSAGRSKRLYRDPDSRVFGGVCSGLAYYMNLDKVLVRVIFFLLIFLTSGAIIPIYLVFWIAVPKSRTAAQRLEMRGEAVNAETLGKTERSEPTNAEGKENSGQPVEPLPYRPKSSNGSGGRVIGQIFGVLLLVVGILSLLGVFAGTLAAFRFVGAIPFFPNGISPALVASHLFNTETAITFIIAILVLVAMPLLIIIYLGSKLLFRYEANSVSIILSALGIWFLSILVLVIISVNAAMVFTSDTAYVEPTKIEIAPTDTLYVSFNEEATIANSTVQMQVNRFKIIEENGKKMLLGKPVFKVRQGNSGVLLEVERSSKGRNYQNAMDNAKALKMEHRQIGNKLEFEPYFAINQGNKWRDQRVEITLRVAEGHILFLDESLLPYIDHTENRNNLRDEEMVGRFWKMTQDGLVLAE